MVAIVTMFVDRIADAKDAATQVGSGEALSAGVHYALCRFSLSTGMIGKILAVRPDGEHRRAVDIDFFAMLDQFVHHGPIDQRFEPIPNEHIGLEAAGFVLIDKTQGWSGPASTTSPTLVRKVMI